jgi:4-amino-4-deoxy-L-arabinose transferase-like glycosyltransferase
MERRLLYPALLAVPFLAGIAALKGLSVEIDTFHGSDVRVYHLPTILQFAGQLPGVDLEHYPAAQTPLFHLLFALWGKVVGFDLWKLRLLNVAISYAAVLVLFRLLANEVGLRALQAFALALVFALSPYFFGASFTLLTDNLAILFALLAVGRFERFRRSGRLGQFALGSLAMGAAVLTRQSLLWLALVAAAVLVLAPVPNTRRLAGAAVAALALEPFVALVAVWGGLVPPGSDPASCGLCNSRPGVSGGGLTLRAVAFTVAVAGLYAAAIHGPGLVRRVRLLRLRLRLDLVIPVAAGAAVLALSPLAYRPIVKPRAGDAGFLWKASDQLPIVGSSSLLFWVLVPLGCLALYLLVRRAGVLSLPALFLGSFLVAALPVRLVYQKYFDPFVLLALALLARPEDLRRGWDYAGLVALGAGFVAYALSFAS